MYKEMIIANEAHFDIFNYFAVEIIEKTGNQYPSQLEIDAVENLLKAICAQISFNKYVEK